MDSIVSNGFKSENGIEGQNAVQRNAENPLATVIMPVYNSPDLIRALNSVCQQDYRPIQLILADDASNLFEEDRIRMFLQNAGNNFSFQILRNAENLGTVRTMNRALGLARGKYIFNLAGDDAYFDEHVIADWISAFLDSDCDVLTGRRADCDSSLETINGFSPSEKAVRAIKGLSSEELFEYIARDNPISGACTAWRAESLRRLGGYDERYRVIEDYPAYLKLLLQGGRIGFFDRVVIRYRGGGMSMEGNSYSQDYIQDYVAIVNNEILPYTRHRFGAKARLRRWQKSVHFDIWYNTAVKKNGDHCVVGPLLRTFNYIYHPVRLCRKLLRKKAGIDSQ